MTASEHLARHHEAILSMVGEPPPTKGGFSVQCPVCGKNSVPDWEWYEARRAGELEKVMPAQGRGRTNIATGHTVGVAWMRCSNEECEELLVQVSEQWVDRRLVSGVPVMASETWFARPKFGETTRPIDPLVRDPFRTDYLEAAAILDISPRMSAVLARKILGDLLRIYGQTQSKYLTPQIDEFAKNEEHPRRIRESLHHFREVADFAAHTQEDQQGQVINVGREEAAWTLEMVDRLFVYFIVEPEKDRQIREAMDKRIADAGRRAISPPPAGPADESD